jgi:hypothetical protein
MARRRMLQRALPTSCKGRSSSSHIRRLRLRILVDTLGLLLNVVVHSAAMQDRDGALLVLNRRTRRFFPFIRQMTSLRRGIARLIDGYTEGVIDKTEFEPRIAGLKQRVSQLQERHQGALEAIESERDLV